ncbi:MAG: GNAT family N-acetyltransferase [Gammaproteobacteria bacterium]|nr:GNAT family N-acetyltransferase [Gammaproteobacteria bacterium]
MLGDQQRAVEAIKRVVHGHRRRPLVLSADRGRGKSASLGIAAAQLLLEGKNILVTAPSLAIAETVFEYAKRLLPESIALAGQLSLGEATIRFIAPDALIATDSKADLVLVDEAAAIPASMLEALLQKYSRLVFATTLHGYEGTGRGFAVRFQKTLDQKTPNWHHFRMEVPIRWAENDLLEKFSFQSLLMNALPVADDLIAEANIQQCQIEIVDKNKLMADEQALTELFGLMVLAHYRTRPSDLQMLLDRDDMTIISVHYQGHIIASAWLVNEGELDTTLSQAVFEGRRRLKGHLLPQSLLAHSGILSAGSLKYQRIVRITVHPAIQYRKVGQTLLDFCIRQSIEQGFDVIGTSFALHDQLPLFWQQSAFQLRCD